MPNTASTNNPAVTYTISDFINMKSQDELTYPNFAIFDYKFGETFVEESITDYYLDELKSICLKVTSFTPEEIARYKYAPDLLAYDLYNSTSIDFIILLCNGVISPLEFDFKSGYLYLPKAQALAELLSEIFNSESGWLYINRNTVKEEKSKDTQYKDSDRG